MYELLVIYELLLNDVWALHMYELLKYKKTYNKKPCFVSLMDPQSYDSLVLSSQHVHQSRIL